MADTYGTHERAALFVLTLENREISNPELVHDYGIEMRPAGRDKLNKAELLKTRKDGRRLVHTITGDGIAWCEKELAVVETPARSGPLARVAFEMLRRIATHLRDSNLRLVDVLHPVDLESMIRTAYGDLSTMPEDWVRLATLRPKLNGADRTEVDQTLLAMTKTGSVHLAPSSNRKALTDDDHAAAIRIGSEDKHLLAIEES